MLTDSCPAYSFNDRQRHQLEHDRREVMYGAYKIHDVTPAAADVELSRDAVYTVYVTLSIRSSELFHRGRHGKTFGWAKTAAYDRRSTSDLWPISHNIGIGDKQKSL